MAQPLRILFVEDLPSDKELAERQLRDAGIALVSERVETQDDFIEALERFKPDLVISDYALPEFDGMMALKLTQELRPDLPLILLTGSMNEDTAVACMKAGAADYVIKEHIHRLPFAVLEAIRHQHARLEKLQADQQLRDSEARFRAVFHNNHAVMLLIDPTSGQVVDANPAACAFYGYTMEELLQKYIFEINTLTPEQVKAEMERAAAQQRRHFEFRHRLASGEIREVEVFSGPIEHNQRLLLYSIVHDVTRRKEAEEALNARNRDLTQLNQLALELAEVNSPQSTYELIARWLKAACGAVFTSFCLYHPIQKALVLRHAEFDPGIYDEMTRILGLTDLSQLSLPLDPQQYQDLLSEPVTYYTSFHTITLGLVPEISSQQATQQLHIDRFLNIAYFFEGHLLGTSVAALREDTPNPSPDLVQSFVQMVSVTLRRIQAEEDLQRSELSLKKAQAVAHVGSWTWTIPENRLQWSDEMYRIFGIDRASFNGDLGEVIARAIHPDDVASVERANRMVIEQGVPMPLEYRVVHPDGTVRTVWAEAGELTFDHQGKPEVLTGIVQDITERRRASQQIELQAAALNAAANAIVITNRDGSIEWVNPAFTRHTGYSEDEVIGLTPRLLKSGAQPPQVYQELWQTILAGKVWRGELLNRRKDGSLYYEENTITPITDPKGQITHFIGVKIDVSARKQVEEALLRKSLLQERIAALGRALSATLDLPQIFRTAEQGLKTMIDCPNFSITLYDAENQVLTAAYFVSDGVEIDVATLPPLRFNPNQSISGRSAAIAARTPIIVNDLAQRSKSGRGIMVGEGSEPQSAIYVPMLAADQVIGLLDLQSYQAHIYTPEDGEWLSVVANQVGLAIQNARLFAQTRRRVSELQALHNIHQAITADKDPQVVYNKILAQVMTQPHVDAVRLYLYQPKERLLAFWTGRGFSSDTQHPPRLLLGEGLAGQAALEKRPLRLFHSDNQAPGAIYDTDWQREGFAAYLGLPLITQGEVRGVLEVFTRQPASVDSEWVSFMQSIAQQFAIAVDNNQLLQNLLQSNQDLVQAYNATIAGWSQAMDLRDRETEGHTERVTQMTLRIAAALGLGDDKREHIIRGALLHDIGKLGVPDAILHKPGPLTDEEWRIMKTHSVLAYEMLSPIEYLQPALAIPYCHHERWDGSGYPRGLKGQQIPLEARIFALVDVYDALTSDRPYRTAWSQQEALAHIEKQSGKHFDPKIVAAFLSLMKNQKL